MCHYDLEGPTVFTVRHPVARKVHRCWECGHDILPGHRYVRSSGIWDGSPGSHAQHEDCADLLQHIADTHCDGVWVFGELREAIQEHYRDEPRLLGRWAAILRARRREASPPGAPP